jgi:hypothetical protein
MLFEVSTKTGQLQKLLPGGGGGKQKAKQAEAPQDAIPLGDESAADLEGDFKDF